jgi:L-aspartate oxidase
LRAARAEASVAVVAKGSLFETNTQLAQGGLASVLSGGDSFEAHIDDTLTVGCGLSERDVVETVVRGGPAAVELLLGLGTKFDRAPGGDLALSREGGHSHARILHAQGDSTGREIQDALCRALEQNPSIVGFPSTFVVDLLHDESGRVAGALAINSRGDSVAFSAGHVILATGGSGQIYRETTNPAIATGDGIALGFRAGAMVRDLEFIQFHPTCLYIAGAARVLISEIVRGAGGILRDKNGRAFMADFHPAAELAPRDVVSRAVFSVMVATADTSVYLDLSKIEGDPHALFPRISMICRFFGIDIARDPIPVRPGAHYQVGGLLVDAHGRTTVPGLWAIGECSSSGLHGANRMGSNSLLEGVVLGSACGEAAARERMVPLAPAWAGRMTSNARPAPPAVRINIEDMIYSLKSLMWRQVGVERTRAGLEDANAKIAFWSRALGALHAQDVRSLELANMLTVARLAALGALQREESRGVHYRTDFPQESDAWQVHTLMKPVLRDDVVASVEVGHLPVSARPSPV